MNAETKRRILKNWYLLLLGVLGLVGVTLLFIVSNKRWGIFFILLHNAGIYIALSYRKIKNPNEPFF